MKNKLRLNEAESYGWVVEDYQAKEAYEFACDYFGEDELNSQIVSCISNEELASCLAYIFRMYDFEEWDKYLAGNDEEDFDESLKLKMNEALYNIIYNVDSEDGYTYTEEETFKGSWTDLQNLIKQMKSNGCYNIDANAIYDEEDFDESVKKFPKRNHRH